MSNRRYPDPSHAAATGWTIGRRIAAARGERNLSQSDLADRVGVHQVTVARWETGRQPLSAVDLVLTAEALATDAAALLPDTTGHQTPDTRTTMLRGLLNGIAGDLDQIADGLRDLAAETSALPAD